MVRFSDLLGGAADDTDAPASATISAPATSDVAEYRETSDDIWDRDDDSLAAAIDQPAGEHRATPEEILEQLTALVQATRTEAALDSINASDLATLAAQNFFEREPEPELATSLDLDRPIADDLIPNKRKR
jgi:hypothetical protein